MENNTDFDFMVKDIDELQEAKIPVDSPIVDIFQTGTNAAVDNNDELDNDKKDSINETTKQSPLQLGKIISGKMAVNIVNIFIPSFIVFALSKFGYRLNKNQLKLTNEEKDILAPVVQECLNYISLNFSNPFYTLAFVSTMIYGSKVMDAIPDFRKIKDEQYKDIDKTISNIIDDDDDIEDNNDETGEDMGVSSEYLGIRERIDSTTIRKDKAKMIVEAIENASPNDIIEAYKIYANIFPERNENYFRKWYYNNIELFSDTYKFKDGE